MSDFIQKVIQGIVFYFLSALFLMVFLAGAHKHASQAIPNLGYWGCLFSLYAITTVTGVIKHSALNLERAK